MQNVLFVVLIAILFQFGLEITAVIWKRDHTGAELIAQEVNGGVIHCPFFGRAVGLTHSGIEHVGRVDHAVKLPCLHEVSRSLSISVAMVRKLNEVALKVRAVSEVSSGKFFNG